MFSFFSIVLKKIIKNRWLVLSQFLGVLIVTSLLSSIPAFSNGITQKILINQLRIYQDEKDAYPGKIGMSIDSQSLSNNDTDSKVDRTRDLFDKIPGMLKLPEVSRYLSVTTQYLRLYKPAALGMDEDRKSINLSAIQGIEDHIDLFDGRLFGAQSAASADDGSVRVYEAIVSDQALGDYGLSVGREYFVEDYLGDELNFYVKIVGVFRVKEENDPFWSSDIKKGRKNIYIDYDLYIDEFVTTHLFKLCEFTFDYYFDYNELKIQDVKAFLAAEDSIRKAFYTNKIALKYSFPARDILETYFEKVGKISVIMLSINVPLLFMLALFILMIALIKIDKERNEISVAASRGAGRFQISAAYFAESLLLALAAFAAGPFCGMIIAKFVGTTTGFMEFINRSAIETPMVPDILYYSLAGAMASVVLTTVPAFFSSAVSVVTRKQSMGRFTKKPFWQRIYLDIIMLAVSGYGLYSFNMRQQDLADTALSAEALSIDPLLFIIPALFMAASALFFLRIYPIFVELLFKIGKRFWPPGIYASLLQTSRAITQYGFISLFIMFTIALGIYNANSARTIKSNAEDRIRYSIGADISIRPLWQSVPISDMFARRKFEYMVPNFETFTSLESVGQATKVYRTDDCKVTPRNGRPADAHLMAVTTHEFGNVSWFRNDLLDYHLYDYLNLIAQEPSAVLISRSLADEFSLKPGDSIKVSWTKYGFGNFIVYAIVDFWPSWNPVPTIESGFKDVSIGERDMPKLVVANYQYVSDRMLIEPWEIWMNLKPGATTADLYEDITEAKFKITSLRNTETELLEFRNDAFQTGLNGAMTVSFLTAMLVCLTGFILFWMRSIKSRELQYGIFRAIGLKSGSVKSMLVLEQLLISGVSIIIGIVIGIVTTNIFVKFFNLAYSTYDQVPPFRTVMESQDYIRLVYFISVMLVIGLGILSMLVSKIRPAQALKLGED